jgi:hypothetical protein
MTLDNPYAWTVLLFKLGVHPVCSMQLGKDAVLYRVGREACIWHCEQYFLLMLQSGETLLQSKGEVTPWFWRSERWQELMARAHEDGIKWGIQSKSGDL